MTSTIERRLLELGLSLPGSCVSRGRFLPWIRSDRLVLLAGQICERDGTITAKGRAGEEVTVERAREAARDCALNLLFHLRDACDGDLDLVGRCLRVGVFVNAPPGFADSPSVGNGASDLLIDLLGDAGRHVRTAVGVSALPGNAVVEVDAIFELNRTL
ncbi:RidA family protein [Bradyrhizobium sp. CCBAU 25338]|uniref:RidA family protein n=1 Tax=Bradyrhizobium sp. CCBAU 25338 TaxID=1641877 RepID=UPI002303810F|nr:RidA family protein [Bradyrhizobium sp. CCBAU 25338]MDA9529023.1 hypothetical protein [Bradyrhizobium sp. CCBAU 25338]